MKNQKYSLWLVAALFLVSILSGCSSLKDAHSLYQKGEKAKALEMAIGYLSDGDPAVRMDAAKLVGQIGGEKAAKALVPLLKDSEVDVVVVAIGAIGQSGYGAIGGALTEMVPTAQGAVFDALAKAYRKLGGTAIDSLVDAFLSQPNAADWKAYRAMLLQTGPSVAKSLAKSFRGKTPAQNEESLKVLVELRSPSVAKFLIEMIGDPEVARMVVRSLVKLGSMSVDPAIAALKKQAGSDGGSTIKELLCEALGGIKSRRAVPILERMTKDSSDLVRGAADRALQKVRGF